MNLRSRLSIQVPLVAIAGIVALSLLAQTADTDPVPIPDFLKDLPDYTLNSPPVQRFLHNYRMRANPDGSLPEARGRRVLTGIQSATPTVALTAPFTTIRNMRWQSIGPSPLAGSQVGTTLTSRPSSGRTVAIAVHPDDPHRWLIAAAAGGIWETLDDGNTFAALTDASPTLAMGAVTYAPSAPNIIYAGTGEYTQSSVSFGGEGVLKSTDGGKNWRQIADDFFKAGTAFSSLHVDPANPNILVAAVTYSIFGRPQTVAATAPIGLFRSNDGGVHWTQTVEGPSGFSLKVAKTDFSRQYAGLGDPYSSAPGSGVYRSFDGGQSWAPVVGPWFGDPRGIGRIELAIAPSDPSRVYVTIQDAFNGGPNDGGLLGLWTTGNAWDAAPVWTAINLAPTDDGSGTLGPCGWNRPFSAAVRQCVYDLVLTVKPTDPDVLFFGGVPLWRYNRATNSWSEISQSVSNPAGGIHADQQGAAWAGSRLIVGNDGGVWSTLDEGTTWIDHNSTLATMQFYEGSLATDASFALGGAQDNGTQLWTGPRAWSVKNLGDGMGNLISSALNWGFSAQNQSVRRTTNGGVTSVSVRGNYAGTAPFDGKMKECPAAPGTVILNGTRVNKTTQYFTGPAGALWSNSGNFGLGLATAIAFGSNCSTYAVGFYGGQLRLTTTDGPSVAGYKDIDGAGQVPDRPVSSIVFDPANGKRVFVALSGFSNASPQNIYVTSDHTATPVQWTNISVPVDAPVDVLAIDPADPQRIFAGTDYGIWLSLDGGKAWGHMGPATGLPIVPVFDIVIRGGRVVAFTHGRSAFVLSNFDINNDGVVNCRDLAVVRSALNSRIGEPRYRAESDINSDNVVDVTDLTMMAHQIGAGSNCSAN